MARNRKKVVFTAVGLRLEMATFTGSRPWMVQGWRPTSATIQPHCPQTITSGMQARAAQ